MAEELNKIAEVTAKERVVFFMVLPFLLLKLIFAHFFYQGTSTARPLIDPLLRSCSALLASANR